MAKSRIESGVDKIVDLLADTRISAIDWKIWIPQAITHNNIMIIANAKNLADGINDEITRSGIVIPKELLCYIADSNPSESGE